MPSRASAAVVVLLALAACGERELSGTSAGKGPGSPCAGAGECAGGLACFSGRCAAAAPAAATCPSPPGQAQIVLGGAVEAVDPGSVCVHPIRTPVLPPDQVQDLGEVQVGAEATFAVTAGTSSFTLVSQLVEGTAPDTLTIGSSILPNAVVPTDVRGPDGKLYYDDLALWPADSGGYPELTGLLGTYGSFNAEAGAFSLPDTSRGLDLARAAGGLPAGSWSFVANDWARECGSIAGCTASGGPGRYRVHAVTRPGPLASTGALDVEIYLVTDPAGALPDAQAATTSAQVGRFVRNLSRYLSGAGLCVGAVTFHDLPAWVRTRYTQGGGVVNVTGAGPCDPLQQLFTVAIAPRRAIHLFLAEEIVMNGTSGPGVVVGVDGSIPGPSGFPGTITGGAIVGLFGMLGAEKRAGACAGTGGPDLAACGTDQLAYIAAHETGHWLGLYHTTEADGTLFDPLSDTPRCPCVRCAGFPAQLGCSELGQTGFPAAFVTNDRCTASADCGGGDNLMFWLLDPRRSAGVLTREQGELVRLNPAVR